VKKKPVKKKPVKKVLVWKKPERYIVESDCECCKPPERLQRVFEASCLHSAVSLFLVVSSRNLNASLRKVPSTHVY
jgi:hypothetical protein